MIPIIREGEGLIGLKDNWTQEQIKQGKITFRIGRFMPYELKMLDKDPLLYLLPKSRIERFNKFLNLFPRFIRKYVVKYVEKWKLFF